jgi:hypothetical protein
MRRLLGLVLGVVGLTFVLPVDSASAGCAWVEHTSFQDGLIHTEVVQECSADSVAGAGVEAVTHAPPRDSDWDPVCVRNAIVMGSDPAVYCDVPPEDAVAALTPAVIGAAFRNLPLPPSVLVVQPPGGRTLVNFATNFYTESGPFTRTVVLLGRRVELRIWPSRFGWVFGDGASLATSSAGSPFPDLEVTHGYRSAGRVGPRVDTTYAAEFRVDGGRWRAVPGAVTIPGAPVGLEVITARPVLVAAH